MVGFHDDMVGRHGHYGVEVACGQRVFKIAAIVGAMSGSSLRSGPLVIRAGSHVPDADIIVTPRIGIAHAADWPLRYFVRGSAYVSPTPAHFVRTAYGVQ